MTFQKTPGTDLELIDELVFKPLDFRVKDVKSDSESQKYDAQNFELNELKVIFRKAKITPTKTGQFVSIWKRNKLGITVPFDERDELDFMIIAAKTSINFGVFIFSKKVLLQHHILSDQSRDGKRGIRIYPSWDETTSRQAQKTQLWQSQYFLDLSHENQIDPNQAKDLLTI